MKVNLYVAAAMLIFWIAMAVYNAFIGKYYVCILQIYIASLLIDKWFLKETNETI